MESSSEKEETNEMLKETERDRHVIELWTIGQQKQLYILTCILPNQWLTSYVILSLLCDEWCYAISGVLISLLFQVGKNYFDAIK